MLAQLKRVFKDTTIYGLGGLLPKAAGFILLPVYTRFLTPADYGIMSLATLVTTMVGVVMIVGQNGSLTLFYRSSDTSVDEDERKRLLFTVVAFVLSFGAAVLGLLLLVGHSLTQALFKSEEFTFSPFLVVALVTAYAQLPLGLLQAVNRARGQAGTHTAFHLASFALNMSFTIYFVVALRQGAIGSLKGTLAAALIVAPVALVVLIRQARPRFSGAWLKKSLMFGLPLVPHFVAGWMLTFSDRYLLERIRTLEEVAMYSLAYNVAMVMNLVSLSINQAWGPVYYDVADSEERTRVLPKLTVVYGAAVAVAAIGLVLFSHELVLLLAAPRFWPAAPLVPIVVAGYYCFASYSVVSTGIFYRKRTKYVPLISAGAAVLNIGLNLLLMPRYGMWAAAWNTLVAYAAMAFVAFFVSRRLMPGTLDGSRLLRTAAVVAVVLAADRLLLAAGWTTLLTLGAKVLVFAMALGVLFALDVLSVRDLRSLVERLARRRRSAAPEQVAAIQAMTEDEAGHTADDTGFQSEPR